MRFVLGAITGAGFTFMLLASGLWYKLRRATNGQVGLSAIAGVNDRVASILGSWTGNSAESSWSYF